MLRLVYYLYLYFSEVCTYEQIDSDMTGALSDS